jgi:hypothetical protein
MMNFGMLLLLSSVSLGAYRWIAAIVRLATRLVDLALAPVDDLAALLAQPAPSDGVDVLGRVG